MRKKSTNNADSREEQEIPSDFIDHYPQEMGELFDIPWPDNWKEEISIRPVSKLEPVNKISDNKEDDSLRALMESGSDDSEMGEDLSQEQKAICRVVSNAITRKEEVMLARAQDAQLLIQPKAFTFAKYPLSTTTQELLIDIISHLQSYVTTDVALVNPKLIGMVNIPLSAKNYPAYRKHYSDFRKDLETLWKDVEIQFRWKEEMLNSQAARQMFIDSDGQPLFNAKSKVKTSATLFSGITEDETRPDMQVVTINPLALPFLIYYGKGVGGTQYQKEIAFQMQKKYSRRLYPILMDFVNRPDNQNKMSLLEFREILEIPASYDNSRIKREIIKPAIDEINSLVKEFRFNIELVTENKINNGKKPSLDTVKFSVTFLKDNRSLHHNNEMAVLITLQDIADRGMNEQVKMACEEIFRRENYQKYISKLHYYDQQKNARKISKTDYKNIMLKIVKDLSGYDLRTEKHIRNARNYKARMERMGKVRKLGDI